MKKIWIIIVLAGVLSCLTATAQETLIPYRPGCGPVDEEKVYDVVEQMPSFPGGPAAMMDFISRTITYPVSALKQNLQGRVIVTFVVERDGSLSHAKVVKSVAPDMDKEALRVVKKMPRWIPGQQNGCKVKVKYTVPVTFRLNKQPVQPVDRSKVIGSKHDISIEQQQQEQRRDTTRHVFCEIPEQMPAFPGGKRALLKYLEENVQYPKELEETSVQGRVIVTCIVEKDGSITGTKVVKGLCLALDAEALRVVSAMPRWIPGKRMGEPIRVKYVIPVCFRLQ
ncbi:MAG: energy transducer TonB [Prevotella sp.]|nr:energy transducer TonB [Prevotella sp.]